MDDERTPTSLRSRLGWFVMLYIGGVLAVVAVAAIFRLLVLNAVR